MFQLLLGGRSSQISQLSFSTNTCRPQRRKLSRIGKQASCEDENVRPLTLPLYYAVLSVDLQGVKKQTIILANDQLRWDVLATTSIHIVSLSFTGSLGRLSTYTDKILWTFPSKRSPAIKKMVKKGDKRVKRGHLLSEKKRKSRQIRFCNKRVYV